MSAWIEIDVPAPGLSCLLVALLVSAWIEITTLAVKASDMPGRTPRECVD